VRAMSVAAFTAKGVTAMPTSNGHQAIQPGVGFLRGFLLAAGFRLGRVAAVLMV